MRSSQKIKLIRYETRSGSFSDEGEKIPISRAIYANEYGVSLNNRLQAQVSGFRIQGKVEIYSFDYRGEEGLQLINGGPVYKILNADQRGDRTILSYGEVMGHGAS